MKCGDVLAGKYVLDEHIGEGGMGQVYRAYQPALAREVAIKVLRPELAANRAVARRFREEAVAASRVRHPRCVTMIDCGSLADGTPFIVMEYVRGRSLGRVIKDESIPLARALDLIQQILSALGAVHAAGIVHADVKSENFLVEHVDGADHVTLIDFGLAREIGDRGVEASVVSGTPEYMAPEVIEGGPPQIASDLYGAGVILYELLVGHTPFAGGSAGTIMQRHLDDLVVPPSLRCDERELPMQLDAIVLRALEKKPVARFADAATMAAALTSPALAAVAPTSRAPRDRDNTTPDAPTGVYGTPRAALARGTGPIARAARHGERKPARGAARDVLRRRP